ncbi:MAG TPA: hypothetical protein VGE59_00380 [Patescibacteria group bacterium]
MVRYRHRGRERRVGSIIVVEGTERPIPVPDYTEAKRKLGLLLAGGLWPMEKARSAQTYLEWFERNLYVDEYENLRHRACGKRVDNDVRCTSRTCYGLIVVPPPAGLVEALHRLGEVDDSAYAGMTERAVPPTPQHIV